jgi:guanosine-3',5'-bis(diphosphate) 3'-pyrophosphohydrolase
MSFDETTGQLLRAIHFASQKHRDQRRKDRTASPYINHPVQVAEVLWRVGGVRDEVALVAAILHDTVEDTATTPEELEREFGAQVLGVVMEVTDDKRLPKDRRKQLQIEHAPHMSPQAKAVKLGDKICNLYDMIHSPPVLWPHGRVQEYVLWTERVVAGLRGTNAALEARYDELLAEAKSKLGLNRP